MSKSELPTIAIVTIKNKRFAIKEHAWASGGEMYVIERIKLNGERSKQQIQELWDWSGDLLIEAFERLERWAK